MTPSEVAKAVGTFFAGHAAAGLVLPSGWFGRPYDNFHRLTACTAAGDTVHVELDGQLNLLFEGPGTLAVRDGDSLVVSGFTRLLWDWRPYGSLESRHTVFSDGKVTLVAPLG